jgi:hypothetical protein
MKETITLIVLNDQGLLQFMTDKISDEYILSVIHVDFNTEGYEEKELSVVDGEKAFLHRDTIIVHPTYVKKVIQATNKKYKEA